MHRLLVIVLGAVVATTIAAAPAPASHESFESGRSPDISPDGKRIVYERRLDDARDLWIMNVDGSAKRPLVATSAGEYSPAWSPDGSRVSYVVDTDDGAELYVVDVATRATRQLTFGHSDWDPDWSPDGSQLVFTRIHETEDEYRGQLFVVPASGGEPRQIVVDDGDDWSPAWSPDGRKIAFVGGPAEFGYIEVLDLASGIRNRLTHGGEEWLPAWLPDGRLTFTDASEDDEIAVVNADGSNRARLLGFPKSNEWGAEFSSDGRVAVFTSDLEETPQVYVARVAGGAARRLTGLRAVYAASGERCTIFGTERDDVVRGTPNEDVLCGLGGNDTLIGRGDGDHLDGGAGDDTLVGGAGTDELVGGRGEDVLRARDGVRERIDGGPGRDRASVDAGDWISFIETLF